MPSAERRLLLMMATLTFVTGVIDAVGFVGLDHVFAGTATGNVLVLGMALGGAQLPIPGPMVALITFACGALATGLVLRTHPGREWVPAVTVLLLANAAVLFTLSVMLALTRERFDHTMQITVSSILALVMGTQAMIARRMAVRDVNTLVVTISLVAWAGESLPRRSLWNRRLVGVFVLFAGALVGTASLRIHIGVPMAAAAVLVFAVALLGRSMTKDPNRFPG